MAGLIENRLGIACLGTAALGCVAAAALLAVFGRQVAGIVFVTLALALMATCGLLGWRNWKAGDRVGVSRAPRDPCAAANAPPAPTVQQNADAADAQDAADLPGPAAPHARWASDPPPPVERRAYVGRVLVVEDHPVTRQDAVAALAALRIDPMLAQNGRRALELLSEKSFDLVLMDCQMPEMNGFEATAAIRTAEFGASAKRRLPVIALIADADEGERARWLAAGMDDQLAKPFTAAELDAVLARWLPRRQPAAPVTGPAIRTVTAARAPGSLAIDARALTMIGVIDPGGRRGLLRDTVQAYVSGTAAQLGELTAALASRDAGAVVAAARALRSASDGIGADGLASAFRELEKRMPDGDPLAACALVDRAIAEFARVVTELRRLVDGLGDR